jgi:hypothetical protein
VRPRRTYLEKAQSFDRVGTRDGRKKKIIWRSCHGRHILGFKLFSFAEIVSVVDNVCMDDTYLVIVLVWNLDTIICSVFQCKSFSLPKKGRKGEGNGRLVSYHPTTSVSLNTSMNNCLAFKC